MKHDLTSMSIAIGQAVNIMAERGITPTEANIEGVVQWAEFILDCKERMMRKHFPEHPAILEFDKNNNQTKGDDI